MGYSHEYRKQNSFVKEKSYALFNATNPKEIEKLIKSGENINIIDSNNNTPLHKMVIKKQFDAVNKLLELGANPNIKNIFGQTPLHLSKDKLIINELLKNGASPYIPDNNGIMTFVSNSIVKEIIEKRFV